MKLSIKKPNTVAVLLLAITLLSIIPKLTLAADQTQSQTGIVLISAKGSATAINNGLSGSVTLNLTGVGSKDSNQELQMRNMTGSLEVGSTNLTISSGHGTVNRYGSIAIFANTSSAGNELFLHGTIQGNTVTFQSPESHLASLSLLALSGNINVNGSPVNSTSAGKISNSTTVNIGQSTTIVAQSNSSSKPSGNVTLHMSTANSTMSGTSTSNVTNSTVSHAIAVVTTNSSILLQSSNQTAANNASPSQNVTVTVTQLNNQTVSVTRTVANVTITNTVTTTVANMTITQANATVTLNNSTITVSTSGP